MEVRSPSGQAARDRRREVRGGSARQSVHLVWSGASGAKVVQPAQARHKAP
ncbi:hypothetical protein [Actinoplanes sp. NPDC089786]|uniref:hypothetical protein n=1 Tax=Actinoplanes sp. NPDC089786 TaxID=3155185 RepID=UPI003439830A